MLGLLHRVLRIIFRDITFPFGGLYRDLTLDFLDMVELVPLFSVLLNISLRLKGVLSSIYLDFRDFTGFLLGFASLSSFGLGHRAFSPSST